MTHYAIQCWNPMRSVRLGTLAGFFGVKRPVKKVN